MKLLSANARMALLVMVDIAYNGGGKPISRRQIAARHGFDKRRIEQVLRQLTAAELLKSSRGPVGGYLLSRERRRINIRQIVAATAVAATADEAAKSVAVADSELIAKVITPLLAKLGDRVLTALESVTVEQLCLAARKGRVESDVFERLDFNI